MNIFLIVPGAALASTVWADDPECLTYDDFIRQVKVGNAKSVTLNNFSSISGTIVDGSTTNEFESYGDAGSANDPLLTRLLKEHEVTILMRSVISWPR